MYRSFALVLASFLAVACSGCAASTEANDEELAGDSESASSKPKYSVSCDIRVNQYKEPTQETLLALVDTHEVGKKTYKTVAEALADTAELRAVVVATDQKCSKEYLRINISACGRVQGVTSADGTFNRFTFGPVNGFFYCQPELVKAHSTPR